MKDNKDESRSIILIIVGCIQKACLIFFVVSLVGIFVSGIFETKHDNRHPWVTPNQTIVQWMKYYFYEHNEDSIFYKPVAKVLDRVPHDGKMRFWFFASAGESQYQLDGPYGRLTDSFPWVQQEMLRIVPKEDKLHYSVRIRNDSCGKKRMIFYTKPPTISFVNCNYKDVEYLYCAMPVQELTTFYQTYKFYDTKDTVSNDYKGGWFKRIEENWYIISPDTTGFW